MASKPNPSLEGVLKLTTEYEIRRGIRLLFEEKMSDGERTTGTIKMILLLAPRNSALARAIIRQLSRQADRAYLWWKLYTVTQARDDLDRAGEHLKLYLPHMEATPKTPNRDELTSAVATCQIKHDAPRDIASLRRGLKEIRDDHLHGEAASLVGLGPVPKPETMPIYDAATREKLLAGYRANIETLLAKAPPEPWLILNDLGEIALLGATDEATGALESGSKIAAKIKLREVPAFVDHVYTCAVRGALSQRKVQNARTYADKIRSPGTKAIAYAMIGLAIAQQRGAN